MLNRAMSVGDDSKTTDFNYAVLDFENLTLDLMVVLSLTLNALSQNTRGSPTVRFLTFEF